MTNYFKVKIDNTKQNSKSKLCRDKYEMVNPIISEYRKLAQNESQAWHNRLEKVIHLELFKLLKFDLTTKSYMHKMESILENRTRTITGFTNRLLITDQKTQN